MDINVPAAKDLNNARRNEEFDIKDKIIEFINCDLKKRIIKVNYMGINEISIIFPLWFYENFSRSYGILKCLLEDRGYNVDVITYHDKDRISISW